MKIVAAVGLDRLTAYNNYTDTIRNVSRAHISMYANIGLGYDLIKKEPLSSNSKSISRLGANDEKNCKN
jgi:hypothetical protein